MATNRKLLINFWITYCEKIKEIAVCDCYLDMVIALIHDGFFSLDKNSQDRVIKKTIRDEKEINEELYVLIGKTTVLCCKKTVFQFDLGKIISEERLTLECFIDIPLIEDEYDNCIFYIESLNDINDIKFACISCVENILCSIAERTHLFKEKCTIMED